MGGKVSCVGAKQASAPPAPFVLPCKAEEFVSGDSLFLSEDYVPFESIRDHKCIVVRIVNVADGDTFRGRHIPNGHKLYPYPIKKTHLRTELFAQCQPWTGKLKGETLRLRIYAVDAPEIAKMGRPGQPYAEEATRFMKKKLLNRIVFVRLLAKDQYGRLIVQVLVPCSSLGKQASHKSTTSLNSFHLKRRFPWSPLRCCARGRENLSLSKKERVEWCEDVSQSLLLAGLATIYTGRNAQYNGNLPILEELLREACDKKKGMFAGEEELLESPGSFKRRMRRDYLQGVSGEVVSALDDEIAERTRGRSVERRNPNERGQTASRSQGKSPKAAVRAGEEADGKTQGEAPQRGRAQGRQSQSSKSRSRSARRRKAAEKAAAAAAASKLDEVDATSDLEAAQPKLKSTGNRRAQGPSGEAAPGPTRTKTLTFSIEDTSSTLRQATRTSNQSATGSMKRSSSRVRRTAQGETGRSHSSLSRSAREKPSRDLGDVSDSDYVAFEEEEPSSDDEGDSDDDVHHW